MNDLKPGKPSRKLTPNERCDRMRFQRKRALFSTHGQNASATGTVVVQLRPNKNEMKSEPQSWGWRELRKEFVVFAEGLGPVPSIHTAATTICTASSRESDSVF